MLDYDKKITRFEGIWGLDTSIHGSDYYLS